MIKSIFCNKNKSLNEDYLLKQFDEDDFYVSNGVVYYYDAGEYDKKYDYAKKGWLCLSLGNVTSRRGDYLHGDYNSDFILKIYIDDDLIIQDIKISDIYNPRSNNTKLLDKAKSLTKNINIGKDKLIVNNKTLKNIYKCFNAPFPTPISDYLNQVKTTKYCFECNSNGNGEGKININLSLSCSIRTSKDNPKLICLDEWNNHEGGFVERRTKVKYCPFCGRYIIPQVE